MTKTIRFKGLIDEDLVNYKKPSMFLSTCFCDWKCCKESNVSIEICQNNSLVNESIKIIPIEFIFDRYKSNSLTESIVIGGLEPFLQFDEIISLVDYFRKNDCFDDIVIYTGYIPNEINDYIQALSRYKNIYVKYGRYIPNKNSRYDEVLGVNLASDNQWGVKIS